MFGSNYNDMGHMSEPNR